jgi:ethanolamine utilization microcompartment shell protein EutL
VSAISGDLLFERTRELGVIGSSLTDAKLIAVTAAKKRAKVFKRTVVLATKSLTLTAGQSETAHSKLNSTGLRPLARRRVLRAALIATQI